MRVEQPRTIQMNLKLKTKFTIHSIRLGENETRLRKPAKAHRAEELYFKHVETKTRRTQSSWRKFGRDPFPFSVCSFLCSHSHKHRPTFNNHLRLTHILSFGAYASQPVSGIAPKLPTQIPKLQAAECNVKCYSIGGVWKTNVHHSNQHIITYTHIKHSHLYQNPKTYTHPHTCRAITMAATHVNRFTSVFVCLT